MKIKAVIQSLVVLVMVFTLPGAALAELDLQPAVNVDGEIASPIGRPEDAPPIGIGKDPGTRAERWKAKIDELFINKKNRRVLIVSNNFLKWLKAQNNDELQKKYVVSVLEVKAHAQEKLGWYHVQGKTLDKLFAKTKNDVFVTEKISAEKKIQLQKKRFLMTERYLQSKKKLSAKLVKIAKAKNKLLKKFQAAHADRKATPERMKKLREKLKKLGEKRKEIRAQMIGESKKFLKERKEFRKAGVRLNGTQLQHLAVISQVTDKRLADDEKIQKNSNKKLLNISGDFRRTWPGAEKGLKQLGKIQEEILSKQKEFLGHSKTPGESSEILRKLDSEIAELSRKYDRILGQIEDSFMDSKTFKEMTLEQQKQFRQELKAIENNDVRVEKNNEKIEAVLAKLPKTDIGDFNHDGKIDKADRDQMENLLGFFPINKGEPHFNSKFDLDGDNRISFVDWALLRQAVKGDRELFPIDPKIEKGDMDGDGKLTMEDVQRLSNHIAWWGTRPNSAITTVGDMDGDGRLTVKDLPLLISKTGIKVDDVSEEDLDIDRNGVADARDLMRIMEMVFHPKEYVSPEMKKAADLNKDGKVSVEDIAMAAKLAKTGPDLVEPQDIDSSKEPEKISVETPTESEPVESVKTESEENTQTSEEVPSSDILGR